MDDDGNGTLEAHELKQVFERAGFHDITDAQIEMAMTTLDADGDGVIDMDEFQKLSEMITESAVAAAGDEEPRDSGSNKNRGPLGGEMGEFLLQGMMATVMNDDFVNAWNEKKKKGQPKASTVGILGKMLEDSVPPPPPDDGPQLTPEQLKARLRKNFASVMTTFRDYDKDRSGTLDMGEWKSALCKLFKKASEEDIEDLFREFDEDGGGTIDYEEFAYKLKYAGDTGGKRPPTLRAG